MLEPLSLHCQLNMGRLDKDVNTWLRLILVDIISPRKILLRWGDGSWRLSPLLSHFFKIHMFNTAQTASNLLIGFLTLCVLSSFALAQQGKVNLYFEKDTFSADIENASLKAVLTRIKEKKGIYFKTWFGGDQALNEKVSVRFRSLSVKDGLERILSNVNHSLVLEGSSVAGVMLFGKPGKPDRTRRSSPRKPRRYRPRRRN